MISSAEDLIKTHEGCVLTAIPDTGNTWEIGWGRNNPSIHEGMTCTQNEADTWLIWDMAVAKSRAVAALGADYWDRVNNPRQAMLIDLAYEIGGTGIAGFHKMLSAIRIGDWPTAYSEAMNSDWAKQVPRRAEMDGIILLTGQWPSV